MTDTRTLELPDAVLAYDVDGPLPPAGGDAPLVLIAQPMTATGFAALTAELGDRTVVRYDPRGLGRSTRSDGTEAQRPEQQAEDVHALIAAIGGGPVDLFASSGGAVTALSLVARHPGDVRTLVAHEPPIIGVLPDADAARRAFKVVTDRYAERGFGAGMAAFIAMTSWTGEYDDAYFAQPVPEPAMFGMPTADDGTRNDPLLSGVAQAIVEFTPDVDAIRAAPTRVVLAVGEESAGTFTARTAEHTAQLLGLEAAVFPSHHGGFGAAEGAWPGQPAAFAARLREVLAG
jgi:pimeloyl-ACP methyl ester carboxylesterase